MAAPMTQWLKPKLLIMLNIFFLINVCLLVTGTLSIQSQDVTQLFENFVIHYNKSYARGSAEYAKRFNTFRINVERSEYLNQEYYNHDGNAVHGVNKFFDLTPEEFNDLYLSGYQAERSLRFQSFSSEPRPLNLTGLPKKVDWRTKSVVTDIKNQKTCGACWAFSVAEVMESMLSIQHHVAVKTLSVQQLIDCDTLDSGCAGGDIYSATRWAEMNGLVEEKYYSLKDKTNTCKIMSASLPRVFVDSKLRQYLVNHEEDILSLLTTGPVAVAVDARTWHSYVQGVIKFHCQTINNHAVSIVGYDLTGDVPHYIVRNSWGSDFGDNGYLYIEIGKNLCGIANEVVSMTVKMPSHH